MPSTQGYLSITLQPNVSDKQRCDQPVSVKVENIEVSDHLFSGSAGRCTVCLIQENFHPPLLETCDVLRVESGERRLIEARRAAGGEGV